MGRKSITHNRPFHSQASLPFGGPVLSDALLSGKKSKQHNSVCLLQSEALFQGLRQGWVIKRQRRAAPHAIKLQLWCFLTRRMTGSWKMWSKFPFPFFPLFLLARLHMERSASEATPCLPCRREQFARLQEVFYHASPIWASVDLSGAWVQCPDCLLCTSSCII